MSLTGNISIMVVAGEASGDEHAAALVRKINESNNNIHVYGMAGSSSRSAGMDTIVDAEQAASIMGIVELFGGITSIYGAYKSLLASVDLYKPKLAILIDFPDFNLRLARALKKKGIKVIYFISPQLWAWRKGRVKSMKKYVDKVAAIFPFETEFYQSYDIDVEYVGHPLIDLPPVDLSRLDFLSSLGLNAELPVIALLPGSRKSEVERLLSPMLAAFERIRLARPGVQAVIPVASGLDSNWINELIGSQKGVVPVVGHARELLHIADVAVVASGTATVQAALSGVPFFVVYKLSPFTYLVGRTLVRGIEHFAMPNLIAGKGIVRELLQGEVTPGRIAAEIELLLGDKDKSQKLCEDLAQVRRLLNSYDTSSDTAAGRVAHMAFEMMELSPGTSYENEMEFVSKQMQLKRSA